MSQTECIRHMEALRDAIATHVIAGKVGRAQDLAVDYALVRDRMLTAAELISAARAAVTA